MASTEPERRNSNSLWDDISALLEQSFGNDDNADGKNADGTRTKSLPVEVAQRMKALRRDGQSRWRELITGNKNTRIRDHLNGRVEEMREKSRNRARKLLTGDANVAIEDHLKTTPVVKWIDKMSFTLGLFGFGITEFIALKLPEYYWVWYSCVMVGLLVLRIYSYVTKKWGFFMLDFCYFVVLTNIVNSVFFPSNVIFWQINFMFSNGPLLVAVLAWRNSLVFHSLDKMTSIFIHFLGSLLTFLARWHPTGRTTMCSERVRVQPSPHLSASKAEAAYTECSSLSVASALLWPCFAYFCWQILQIILTEGIFQSMISNDNTLQTSIRWLCKDKRNAMHQLCKSVCLSTGIFAKGETFDGDAWKSKIIFWVAQFVYTIVTLIPGIIVYHSYWLHVGWLIAVMFGVTWNGGKKICLYALLHLCAVVGVVLCLFC